MTRIAIKLHDMGYVLRSGAAFGADSAFEAGAGTAKEIFLPWPGFNDSTSSYASATRKAYEIAAKHHPVWYQLSRTARAFHARNTHQVLGWHCDDPVKFVICWTPAGATTGGTGQAIRLANAYHIPVVNLQHQGWKKQLKELVL